MDPDLSVGHLLGPEGPGIAWAMAAASRFLGAHSSDDLLSRLGRPVPGLPAFQPIDKRALQDSFGGNQTGASDDYLTGLGLFYVTEQGRLFLDGTSGHYQMLWGYNHPDLCAAVAEASNAGVVWDNHSTIPQAPVKQLARRLLESANAAGDADPLNKVLLGVCTGSVACAAALKIQLKVYQQTKPGTGVPVVVAVDGNYHGSDMVPQFMRGLWPELTSPVECVRVQPGRHEDLERVFRQYGERVAGFWAEPVMMNREALALDAAYLELGRRCCDEVGALMCVDEIQTGFWRAELFDYRALNLRPDLVVVGKGMTAGFHPLSGVLFKHRHDVLEQYDAISTNGSAALPALVALASLEMIRHRGAAIRQMADRIERTFQELAAEFPGQIQRAQGRGYLAGLKFRSVEDARQFHRRLLGEGIWTRVHAYHEGHSTLLTKFGLLADEGIIDAFSRRCRDLLGASAGLGSGSTASTFTGTS